ncbi:hypothetical protein J2S97_001199 [Arthrobacter oryzae]|nr:hypothetical protein [Arthrobacter oryzae]
MAPACHRPQAVSPGVTHGDGQGPPPWEYRPSGYG